MLLVGESLKGELSQSQFPFGQLHETIDNRIGIVQASSEELVDAISNIGSVFILVLVANPEVPSELRPNENKMSDGQRERALTATKRL